jgi:predicted transglutaminase-like cysteine proteinase
VTPCQLRQLQRIILALAVQALALTFALGLDIDRLIQTVQHLGGQKSEVTEWQGMVENARSRTDTMDKLRQVNEYFNHRIAFYDDTAVWGQSDYWATPAETLAMGRGDCEDFAIAKYFSLQLAGVPIEQLRIVYVKARIGGSRSSIQQAHMVLAYYQTPDAEPLVLDNLITDLRPASQRSDLTPVFSFNSQGIWTSISGSDKAAAGGVGRLSRWQDLLQRARREGFD